MKDAMNLPLSDFMEESQRVVDAAKQKDIVIRLLGACAVKTHCPKFRYLFEKLDRTLTDLDFISYGRFKRDVPILFTRLGYTFDERFSAFLGTTGATGLARNKYADPTNNRIVDVFFDRIEMCHTIDFAQRLELDFPTISLTDLLLEKMQIVEINEKDIKDTIIMLREHKVDEAGTESVDTRHVASLLSQDWGFYYTVTTNLKKVETFLDVYAALTDEDRSDVSAKISWLIDTIDKQPKSMGWKMRARMGTRKKWYREVA